MRSNFKMNLKRLFSVLFKSNQIRHDGTWYTRHWVRSSHSVKMKDSKLSQHYHHQLLLDAAVVVAAIYWYSITVIHCVREFTKRKIKGFLFHSFNFLKITGLCGMVVFKKKALRYKHSYINACNS